MTTLPTKANVYLADAQPTPMLTVRMVTPRCLFALWFAAGMVAGVTVALVAGLVV
jgi:hypothetical protein